MKPTYENQGDAENERQLALLLDDKWKCKMQRQMKYAQFDYVALLSIHSNTSVYFHRLILGLITTALGNSGSSFTSFLTLYAGIDSSSDSAVVSINFSSIA